MFAITRKSDAWSFPHPDQHKCWFVERFVLSVEWIRKPFASRVCGSGLEVLITALCSKLLSLEFRELPNSKYSYRVVRKMTADVLMSAEKVTSICVDAYHFLSTEHR